MVGDVMENLPELDCEEALASMEHENLKLSSVETQSFIAACYQQPSATSQATVVATVAPLSPSTDGGATVSPAFWTASQVAQFLDSNNCSSCTHSFVREVRSILFSYHV